MDYADKIKKARWEKDRLSTELQKATDEKTHLAQRQDFILEAMVAIQETAMETQQALIIHLEDIVNKVLQTCFPDYSFKMEFDVGRDKSTCNLKFFKGDNETDLMDGDSGGALNTATIAIRIAVWSLSGKDNCLVLDEAFSNLDPTLHHPMGEVLSELSHELGLQIILISHSRDIDAHADKVHFVSIKDNVSEVA